MENTEENNRNKGGQFAKGHKGLKPKGAVAKTTSEIKERLQKLMDSYDEDMMIADLESLKPPDRLKIMTGLLEYVLPKLNKTDYTLSKDSDEIKVELPE
jgi:hypothetical protein